MSERPISQDRRDRILQTAATWVSRIQEGELPPEALDAWVQWLHASPEHQRAFDDVQGLWRRLDKYPYVRRTPTDAGTMDDDYTGEESVEAWLQQRHRPTRPKRAWPPRWVTAAATVTAISLAASALWWLTTRSAPDLMAYRTVTAQHQSVTLPDGSVMDLGAASSATVAYTQRERSVNLVEGIAYFSVAERADYPFVVHAGGGTVTAVGTEFSVQRRGGEIAVVVSDGLVEVAKPLPSASGAALADPQRQPEVVQLPAGQRVAYSTNAGLQLPTTTDIHAATAWRDGQLIFEDMPLADAISDLNRYSRIPIELRDADLGALRVTGYVVTSHVDGWLNGLEAVIPVTVTRSEDRVILSHRRDGPADWPTR